MFSFIYNLLLIFTSLIEKLNLGIRVVGAGMYSPYFLAHCQEIIGESGGGAKMSYLGEPDRVPATVLKIMGRILGCSGHAQECPPLAQVKAAAAHVQTMK